jgi:acyl-CoA hydrolase
VKTKIARLASESEVIMTEIVLPSHTNALGSIFGGTITAWIDIAGAIAATRHARSTVVTASIDALHFIAPVKLGHFVYIRASVNCAFNTSVEVGVRVESEDPKTGLRQHTCSAYLTFVALDEKGMPTSIPELVPETKDQKRRFKQAKHRKSSRLELAQQIRKMEKQKG